MPKAFPVRVHQQDRGHGGRDLSVDASAEMVQNVLEACAISDHFKRPLFCGVQRFGSLSILNIRAGPIPLQDFTFLVPIGNGADEKPAIFSVVPAQARFDLATLSRSEQCPPAICQWAMVIRMNSSAPAPTNCLVNREARIVEPPLIKEFDESVGPTRPCQRRDDVDHGSIPIF